MEGTLNLSSLVQGKINQQGWVLCWLSNKREVTLALGVGGDLPLLKSVDPRCPVFSSGKMKAETVRGDY